MNTAVNSEPRIKSVRVTNDEIIADLFDGRVISVPLAWSWRLSEATPKQRAKFRLIGAGQGIHWPEVDEDISVEGMLHGVPAHRPRTATPANSRSLRNQTTSNKRTRPKSRAA
jgi:hypothetical protein